VVVYLLGIYSYINVNDKEQNNEVRNKKTINEKNVRGIKTCWQYYCYPF
jgi:hypothetical protein